MGSPRCGTSQEPLAVTKDEFTVELHSKGQVDLGAAGGLDRAGGSFWWSHHGQGAAIGELHPKLARDVKASPTPP